MKLSRYFQQVPALETQPRSSSCFFVEGATWTLYAIRFIRKSNYVSYNYRIEQQIQFHCALLKSYVAFLLYLLHMMCTEYL
jgi:hypothetical protein